jgi:hypothetical protein
MPAASVIASDIGRQLDTNSGGQAKPAGKVIQGNWHDLKQLPNGRKS